MNDELIAKYATKGIVPAVPITVVEVPFGNQRQRDAMVVLRRLTDHRGHKRVFGDNRYNPNVQIERFGAGSRRYRKTYPDGGIYIKHGPEVGQISGAKSRRRMVGAGGQVGVDADLGVWARDGESDSWRLVEPGVVPKG